ncbi:unnamed protein product [Brassica rapa subsp. trilocularis]
MDSSEADLDRVEAQRSTDVSRGQRKRRYFLVSLIKRGISRIFRSLGPLQDGVQLGSYSVSRLFSDFRLSDFFAFSGVYVPMSPEILSAVSEGDAECIGILRSKVTPAECLKSDQGDSILHLAAGCGHVELVKIIASAWPFLLMERDSKYQLPLHVAARAGHVSVVLALVQIVTFVSDKMSREGMEGLNPYVLKNNDGDTALHLAMKCLNVYCVIPLGETYPQAWFLANNKGISPLFIAVQEGFTELVKYLLENLDNDETDLQLEGRKDLVHVALKAKNTVDIIDVILKKYPSLENERDEEGMTCLSFGASIGFYKGVCNLLDRSTRGVYDDGSFPIHIAVQKCHMGVVFAILIRCPNSKHLLNRKGQNILHIASRSGKAAFFLSVLLERTSKGKCMNTVNNDGLTSLGIVESNLQPNYIFMERVTLMVLLYFYTSERQSTWLMFKKKITRRTDPPAGLVIFLDVASAIFIFLMLFLLGPHVLLRIPGIPAAFGAYFVLFVLLVDDDHHEQASTAKISSEEASAAKSSSEEASAAKISVTTKKVLKRKAVVMGKVQDLEKILQENEIPVLDQVTFQGNTILHLAAIYGHDHLVRRILDHELNVLRSWNPNLVGNFAPSFSHYQTLLVRQNSEGDLALHVAAAAGHELIVEFLVESLRRLPQDRNIVVRSEQILVGNIFSVSNNDGFTALHLALKGNHVAVSLQLVREDQSTCFLLDKEGVSSLYMAAEAGHVSLVEHMLQGLSASFVGKSVVCAAVKSKNLDVLRAVLESDSDLVDSRDEDGRTPLAFAASIGYDIGVEHMLTRFGSSTQIAYIESEDGSFPIHSACVASRKTRNAALKVILKHHPDTIEMLNSKGQNVLHVAAENGNAGAVGYLLRKADVKRLINEQDLEGNTPLHLASINSHPKVVSLFIHDSRVDLKVLNHKGSTALDAAEEYMAAIPSLQQWLIWVALVSAGTTRAPRVHLKADSPTTEEDFTLKMYKDRVNTLLVVATLVATMAFAAGLSVPLGYNSTEFKSNVKHSYKESAFNAFVICNSIAVYSAVISTVALIGTQLADMKCMLTTFKFIVPLLGFSIISMSLAFVAGLYLVLGQHHWLAVFVLATGGFYLMALLLLIIPYASPYTFSPLVFRYFLRFPFSMLVFFAYWRDGTDGECSSRVFRWSFIG